MTNDTTNKIQNFLPAETMVAIEFMIGVSQTLCDLSDEERTKIEQDDFVGLALLQDKKKALADTYSAASREFKARIEEFKQADKSKLKQLEDLQQALGEKARGNAAILDKMIDKMQQSTHTTLLNAQSMAQGGQASYGQKPVNGAHHKEKEIA